MFEIKRNVSFLPNWDLEKFLTENYSVEWKNLNGDDKTRVSAQFFHLKLHYPKLIN